MGDDAVVQLEGGVGRVVGGALVCLAVLVDPLRDVDRAEAGERLHAAEEVVDDVAPVAEHVDDDAAAVFLPVVPRGALGGLPVGAPLKDPVAELAADGEDLPEEARVDQPLQLQEAGKPKLVLDDAVLQAGGGRLVVEGEGLGGRDGGRLLAVDRLLRGDGLADALGAAVGGLGIEVDLVEGIGEGRVEVGRVALDAVGVGQLAELVLVAADEDRVGHDRLPGGELHAALLPDREDRADEVLVGAHASRDAVHDDADLVFFAHSLDRG